MIGVRYRQMGPQRATGSMAGGLDHGKYHGACGVTLHQVVSGYVGMSQTVPDSIRSCQVASFSVHQAIICCELVVWERRLCSILQGDWCVAAGTACTVGTVGTISTVGAIVGTISTVGAIGIVVGAVGDERTAACTIGGLSDAGVRAICDRLQAHQHEGIAAKFTPRVCHGRGAGLWIVPMQC